MLVSASAIAATESIEVTHKIGADVVEVVRTTYDANREGGDAETVRIRRQGKVVFQVEDHLVMVDNWFQAREHVPFPPLGTNVTGGKNPQVIVQTFSGGAHCCLNMVVVDLGPEVKVIETPVGSHYYTYFEFDPALKQWILVGHDPNYAYWRSSFGGSSAPQVQLVYGAQGWTFAASQKTPAPSAETWKNWLDLANSVDVIEADISSGQVPTELYDPALELAYGGHWQLAQDFVKAAWPKHLSGQAKFSEELFACKIPQSQFWPEIARLNNIPATAPVGECP